MRTTLALALAVSMTAIGDSAMGFRRGKVEAARSLVSLDGDTFESPANIT